MFNRHIWMLHFLVLAAPNVMNAQSDQHKVDLDVFQSYWYSMKAPPDEEALERLKVWLKGHPSDMETTTCVAQLMHKQLLHLEEDTAEGLLRKASEGGFPAAQAWYAYLLLTGEGVPQDVPAGKALLETALKQDNLDAIYLRGAFLADGVTGFVQDREKASEYLRKAAEGGLVHAWTVLALNEARRGNAKVAIEAMTQAAEAGDPQAQAELARWYSYGQFVPRDYGRAIKWYEVSIKSAVSLRDRGTEAINLRLFGEFYASSSVANHERLAFEKFKRASEIGDRRGLYLMANCYARGDGAPMDTSAAARILQKLAEEGLAEAQVALGRAYIDGLWVPRDVERAKMLIKAAMDQGDPEARVIYQWIRVSEQK